MARGGVGSESSYPCDIEIILRLPSHFEDPSPGDDAELQQAKDDRLSILNSSILLLLSHLLSFSEAQQKNEYFYYFTFLLFIYLCARTVFLFIITYVMNISNQDAVFLSLFRFSSVFISSLPFSSPLFIFVLKFSYENEKTILPLPSVLMFMPCGWLDCADRYGTAARPGSLGSRKDDGL